MHILFVFFNLMSMTWKTRFTSLFPARVPQMIAPMAGVSGGLLAAESCKAGALGFIAAGHCIDSQSLQKLEDQIKIFRERTAELDHNVPLCIGWIGFSSFRDKEGFRLYEEVLKKHKPEVVQFFAPAISLDRDTGRSNVDIARQHSAKVVLQVGSYAEAVEAVASGAEAIVAQGSEAGGHGLRREQGSGVMSLAARLVKLAAEARHKPIVLAAGGIMDGRGVAAALALGCDAAVLGTRLWASKEAMNKQSLKDQLVVSQSCDDVQRTRVFDQIQNSYSATPWPLPYDSVGALRNTLSEEWDSKPLELDQELAKEKNSVVSSYKAASQAGDPTIAQVLSGEGVGEIDSIDPAYDIILRIDRETQEVVQSMSSLLTRKRDR